MERNINVWLPLAAPPPLDTWPATQACALTGIRPVTCCFAGGHSIRWATPARAAMSYTHHLVHHVLFFKSNSFSLVPIQGEESQAPPLEGRSMEWFVPHFKPLYDRKGWISVRTGVCNSLVTWRNSLPLCLNIQSRIFTHLGRKYKCTRIINAWV